MVCRAGEITVSHHFSQLGVHQYAVAVQNGNLRRFYKLIICGSFSTKQKLKGYRGISLFMYSR